MVVMIAVSCKEKKEEMGPEAVVEAFNRAVAAGDFSTARSFCDTESMDEYLGNYRKVMNSFQKEDSSALVIASSMLAGAEFEVIGTEKNGEERIIEYRLSAEGLDKTRRATVKKEEGEWKVTGITDAI